MPSSPNPATIVETLTMTPVPRSAMPGARAAVRKYGTLTLSANSSSNAASVVSAGGRKAPDPALLTRLSTWPSTASAAAAGWEAAAGLVASRSRYGDPGRGGGDRGRPADAAGGPGDKRG